MVPSALRLLSRACASADLRASLQEVAKTERHTFLSWLLGTDCYSMALDELDTDCRGMGEEQRTRCVLGAAVHVT